MASKKQFDADDYEIFADLFQKEMGGEYPEMNEIVQSALTVAANAARDGIIGDLVQERRDVGTSN